MPRFIPRPSRAVKLSLTVTSFVVLAFAAMGARMWLVRPAVAQAQTRATAPTSPTTSIAPDYVRRGLLKPSLRENLRSLGDRLEKPGKERLTMTGTLRRKGDAQPHPVSLVWEARGRLRVEEQGGGSGAHTFVFDRDHVTGRTLSDSETALVETFLYDTPESFFALQEVGAPTRPLGNRYRLNDSPDGAAYDVYEVQDPDAAHDPAAAPAKFFCFNRDTLMLERVSYEKPAAGDMTSIELRLEDWGEFAGQKMPRRIVRLENGEQTLVITVDAVTFGPRGDNSAFVTTGH
jgi:hypothetical protein